MKHGSDERWRRLRGLFDELEPQSASVRAERLARLGIEDPALAAELGEMLEHAPALEPSGARRVAGYALLERLPRGRLGEVWRARHAAHAHELALRIVPLGPGAVERVARLRREGPRFVGGSFPGHAAVLDAGLCEEPATRSVAAFLVHEFRAPTDTFEMRCALPGAGAGARLALAVEACEAVARLHERELIHGRLTPSNLRVDDHGRLVILDLCVALLDDAPATQAGDARDLVSALARALPGDCEVSRSLALAREQGASAAGLARALRRPR